MTREEFKLIFDAHFDSVRNYVFFRSGDTELATDLAQETFLRIWEKQKRIEKVRIKGLLYKIAGDLFVSYHRKTQRSFNFFHHYKMDEHIHTPEELMAFEQLKENYRAVLNKMPELQRTVFLMHRVENLKYSEIAEMTGISVKAVEKRMNKALGFLRKNLNQE